MKKTKKIKKSAKKEDKKAQNAPSEKDREQVMKQLRALGYI